MIPKELVIQKYLAPEQRAIQDKEAELESVQAEVVQYEEEHAGEEGLLSDASNDKGSITKTTLTKFIKDNKKNPDEKEAVDLGNEMLKLFNKEAALKKEIKVQLTELDQLTLEQYGKLTEAEVRELVVDDKWLSSIKSDIQNEIDSISQRLTIRIKELGERYENKITELESSLSEIEDKVSEHLQKMGLVWS